MRGLNIHTLTTRIHVYKTDVKTLYWGINEVHVVRTRVGTFFKIKFIKQPSCFYRYEYNMIIINMEYVEDRIL